MFDVNGPLIATPLNLPGNSGNLDTLASVACNVEAIPVQSLFNAQCQTPASWNPVKAQHVSCGTQTDWADVLELPTTTSIVCEDSFMSSVDPSRDDESFDATWEPSEEDEDDESDQAEWESGRSQVASRKFIVSETCLDDLLSKCSICSKPVSVTKTVKGCVLSCTRSCSYCQETETWESQPSMNGLAEGHLDLSAAIMFSGSATVKFLRALRFAGVVCFNDSTFYNVQKHYLMPAINHVWESHQRQMIREMKERGSPLVLGGDGRCCSPGHTAKYGTYSMMDLDSGQILDIQLVQIRMLSIVLLCACALVPVWGETADSFKQVLLDKHNEMRKKQGGSNMNKLVWSDTLAKEADAWISHCNFEHENKGRGENLAFNTGSDDLANIDEAMQAWYDEIKDYNYAGKACGMSCHYTQLVWAQTREVGCAIKKCPSFTSFGQNIKDAWYIGCWYDPAGNDMSEYPYNKGAPCSECLEGQTCENELCAGIGKEKCEDKNADCIMWEAGGSCDSNKKFMEKNCRQACGFCTGGAPRECKDVSPKCDKFKKTCQSNKPWMKPNCMKTCGYC